MNQKVLLHLSETTCALQLSILGGVLKIPVDRDVTVIESAEKVNGFMSELFKVDGVKEVFEKYGAEFIDNK